MRSPERDHERPVPTLVQPALRRSRGRPAADGGASPEPRTRPPPPPPRRRAIGPCSLIPRPRRASSPPPARSRRPEEQPTLHLPGAGDEAEPTPAPHVAEPTPAPHVAQPTPAVARLRSGPRRTCPQASPRRCRSTDLPAGLDPDELNAVPATSARRGKLRRRIAFLRAAREVLLRDLGGFVYELHRTAHDIEHEAHRRLRETKLTRLSRVDAELHELEYRLDDVRRQVIVREPGVGGECPQCGELFGSAAHYCSQCGLPLTESARREQARARQPEPLPDPVVAPPAGRRTGRRHRPADAGAPAARPGPSRRGQRVRVAASRGRVLDGRTVRARRLDAVRRGRGQRTGRIGARYERRVTRRRAPRRRSRPATRRPAARPPRRPRANPRRMPARRRPATPWRRAATRPAATKPLPMTSRRRRAKPRRRSDAGAGDEAAPPTRRHRARATTAAPPGDDAARRATTPRATTPAPSDAAAGDDAAPRGDDDGRAGRDRRATRRRMSRSRTVRCSAPWSGAREHDGDSAAGRDCSRRAARAALPALREHAGARSGVVPRVRCGG